MNENEKNNETTPEVTPVSEPTPTPEVPTVETTVVKETTTETTVDSVEPVMDTTPAAAEMVEETNITKSSKKPQFMVAAVVIVLLIFIAIFYSMEKNGQLNTGVFDGVEQFMNTRKTVATVNDKKITGHDLAISVEQITAGAKVQGIDVTDPQVKEDIQAQAIEVLVNTELLKQEAAKRGIEITEDDVAARYDSLVTEVGGEETLKERMAEFGIDDKTLQRDIKTELTIQTLLDEIFAEEVTEVTDEEAAQMYASIGGEEAGYPAFEELKDQLKAQLQSGKEQEVITNFIELLRTNAVIEVLI